MRSSDQKVAPDETVGLRTRMALAVVCTIANTVLYLLPNRLAARHPIPMPWTAIDAAVPFVPESLWVYLSDYFLVAGAFFLMPGPTEIRRYIFSYFAMLLVGMSIHWFWPTVLPRDAWPVTGESLTALGFQMLRVIDQPRSCLPSMHVAGSSLAALALWRHAPWQRLLWALWATAVAFSTLTTKQHYLVDLLAGLALAVVVWLVFMWWPARREAIEAAAARVPQQ